MKFCNEELTYFPYFLSEAQDSLVFRKNSRPVYFFVIGIKRKNKKTEIKTRKHWETNRRGEK